jgi:hypothetical protein
MQVQITHTILYSVAFPFERSPTDLQDASGSVGLISFYPRLQTKRKVDFEINAIETTRVPIIYVSQCSVYLPISRAYFTFQSFNSCYSKHVWLVMRDHSCDVNRMCKRELHDTIWGPTK